jgi:hypothetical protein
MPEFKKMKRVIYTSSLFYYSLIIYLIGLLCFNIYWSQAHNQILGVLPITIQGILLYLIITRNSFVKRAIVIWASVFVIAGPALIIIADLLTIIAGNSDRININRLIVSIFALISGVIVVVGARKTILISKWDSDLRKDALQNKGL